MIFKHPLLLGVMLAALTTHAETVTLEFDLPHINTADYERPFVAVWAEQPGQRQAVKDIALWYNNKKWLKDIRRWWRKSGRYSNQKPNISQQPGSNQAIDAISGATRSAGHYQVVWDGRDAHGKPLTGPVTLYFEAVREHGDRSLLKQTIQLGNGNQDYILKAGSELGPVTIIVGEHHALTD